MRTDKKIKYLHLCTAANYVTVNGFVKLINENFDPKEHFFIVRDDPSNKLQQVSGYSNVLFLPEAETAQRKELFGYLRAAEHVYFHSMGWYWKTQARLLLCPKIMKKSTWVEWGADLYGWRRTDGNRAVRALVNFVHKKWRSGVESAVMIFPGDEKTYRQEFGVKTKIYHAIYSLYYHESLDRQKPEKPLNDGKYHVLLGHSAVKTCYHFDCLDSLAHFAGENIVIHIPLTYGDMAYRDEVMAYARKLFPEEKLDFILENVPLDDYVTFLWNVDAAVFKVYRQIALGNICKLLYMCKKVFLPEGSLMYDTFTEKETEIYDFGKIAEMTFEEFSAPAASREPSDYIRGRMTKESVVEQWRTVFRHGREDQP